MKQKKRQENASEDNDMSCSDEDPSSVKITPLVMEDLIDIGLQIDSEMGYPELRHPPEERKRKKLKENNYSALENDDKKNVRGRKFCKEGCFASTFMQTNQSWNILSLKYQSSTQV